MIAPHFFASFRVGTFSPDGALKWSISLLCLTAMSVLPTIGFVVQFGIASDPDETSKWDFNIEDDAAIVQSNIRGTVSYATAGPGTRTTQLFINLVDNGHLDQMGFVPIGIIGEDAMNTVVLSLYNPTTDSDGIDQGDYEDYGNAWLLEEYPDVDLIVNTTVHVGDEPSNAVVNVTSGDIEVKSSSRISQEQQAHRFHGCNYQGNCD
jgi:peptidyl-prolyl cis-trans isomerase A (cyclophilin A)